jgi:hypothetical protein
MKHSPLFKPVLPGLIAGSAFLGFEMLVGAFTTSAWAFPESIPQTLGIAAPTWELEPLQLTFGIIVHLGLSVGLAALFIALAQRFRVSGLKKLLAAGVLYMWAESAITIWVVLHTLFPATLPIEFDAIPFWASFVGRTGFGVILAATVLWDQRQAGRAQKERAGALLGVRREVSDGAANVLGR